MQTLLSLNHVCFCSPPPIQVYLWIMWQNVNLMTLSWHQYLLRHIICHSWLRLDIYHPVTNPVNFLIKHHHNKGMIQQIKIHLSNNLVQICTKGRARLHSCFPNFPKFSSDPLIRNFELWSYKSQILTSNAKIDILDATTVLWGITKRPLSYYHCHSHPHPLWIMWQILPWWHSHGIIAFHHRHIGLRLDVHITLLSILSISSKNIQKLKVKYSECCHLYHFNKGFLIGSQQNKSGPLSSSNQGWCGNYLLAQRVSKQGIILYAEQRTIFTTLIWDSCFRGDPPSTS